MKNIKKLHNLIERSIMTIDPPLDYDRTTSAIIKLAECVSAYDGDTESIWYIGESGYCCLADLIVGAYWHYTDWHSGQYSKSYAALCALSAVFSPGMAVLEKGSGEYDVYLALTLM